MTPPNYSFPTRPVREIWYQVPYATYSKVVVTSGSIDPTKKLGEVTVKATQQALLFFSWTVTRTVDFGETTHGELMDYSRKEIVAGLKKSLNAKRTFSLINSKLYLTKNQAREFQSTNRPDIPLRFDFEIHETSFQGASFLQRFFGMRGSARQEKAYNHNVNITEDVIRAPAPSKASARPMTERELMIDNVMRHLKKSRNYNGKFKLNNVTLKSMAKKIVYQHEKGREIYKFDYAASFKQPNPNNGEAQSKSGSVTAPNRHAEAAAALRERSSFDVGSYLGEIGDFVELS